MILSSFKFFFLLFCLEALVIFFLGLINFFPSTNLNQIGYHTITQLNFWHFFKVLVSFTCFEGNGVWLAINSWQIPQQYKLFSRNLSWKWFLLRIIELIFERVKWFFAMIFGLTCSSPHAGSITTAWTVKFVLSLVLSALVCTLFTLEIVSNTMKFLPQHPRWDWKWMTKNRASSNSTSQGC